MKQAILLTTHCWNSKRRAGFHWIADSLWRAGWDVLFVTDVLSWIDRLKGCYRFNCVPPGGFNRVVKEMDRLDSYVVYHPWRPTRVRLDVVNHLTYPWFSTFGRIPLPGLEKRVREADLLIFESSFGLMFFDRFKLLNPKARFVYRVSDDLHIKNAHAVLLDTERRIAPHFDLVSTYQETVQRRFEHLPHARLSPHGVPCHLYDQEYENPYKSFTGANALFVGTAFFDMDFLNRASRLFPEVNFHMIGPIGNIPVRPNIIAYGELPYTETIPYVKFADIGLNPLTFSSFANSNKVVQFTYCRLSIVTSDLNQNDQPHVFCYHPGDDTSIEQAIRNALSFDRNKVPASSVQSWDQLTAHLIGNANG